MVIGTGRIQNRRSAADGLDPIGFLPQSRQILTRYLVRRFVWFVSRGGRWVIVALLNEQIDTLRMINADLRARAEKAYRERGELQWQLEGWRQQAELNDAAAKQQAKRG